MKDDNINIKGTYPNFTNKESVEIRGPLKCGNNIKIDINTIFDGNNTIRNNVEIQANCIIKNSIIGEGTIIKPFTTLDGTIIGKNCTIGPYANLRSETEIKKKVSIGNFVEIKKSLIGDGTKINHLSFIGDTYIENNVVIGAGTITCNHDGIKHNNTIIREGAYIGSGCKLIAPIEIGSNATIGSGSVITENVPSKKLALARVRQSIISHWVRKKN